MPFNQAYNTDDVLYRAITVGLLNLLNRNIVIKYQTGPDPETDFKEVAIPFFPAMFNDERFMQDFYQLYAADCDDIPRYTEGNNDPVPRGVIQLSSLTINSAALTNKFIRGTYNKQENGTINAYSAFLNPIPLTINWDVQIKAATVNEAYKIIQQTIEVFYKVAQFSVDFRGLRVPCQVGFSQDYSIERPLTFSYGEDNAILVKFILEMETYQPVFDKPSERFKGNIMTSIGTDIVAVSGVSGASGYSFAQLDINTSLKLYKNPSGYSGPKPPYPPPGPEYTP
jgi:hypothetical protein